MKIGSWLFVGFLLLQAKNLTAQQLPQGSLYTLNPFVVNPGVTGAYDFADVRLSYRRQWMGLDDAPNTVYVTAHTPIGYGDKVPAGPRTPRYAGGVAREQAPPAGTWRWGGGMVLLADRTGPTERTIAQLTGAAHVTVPGDWQLSVGAGAGMLQYAVRFDRIQTATGSDPILPTGRVSLIRPYFSFGVLARKGNFWGGASVLSPAPVSLAYPDKATGAAPVTPSEAKILPHYYLTATYRLDVLDGWVVFPQVWVKSVGKAPVSVESQVRVQYAERVWAGIQYRHRDSLGGVLGMALSPSLTLSYAYEYPLSMISTVSSGSHEVLLGFRFNNRAAIYCPPMGW